MLTYENFVSILLASIEEFEINIAYTQELIDTHALGRSLSITCLPNEVEDRHGPIEPSLRAVVAFRWSPEFTIFSLRGSESLDNIERFVDERLYANPYNGPSLDVEVTYHIPLTQELQRDVNALPSLAQTLHEIHASVAVSEDPLRVNSQISFIVGRTPRVESVQAVRIWSVDDALYDPELLAVVFEEMCIELRAMLELLRAHYQLTSEEEIANQNELLMQDRQYLKPPTA